MTTVYEELKEQYLQFFARDGITTSEFNNEVKELTQRFDSVPSFEDVIWGLYNKKLKSITQTIVKKDSIYFFFDMAYFLHRLNLDCSSVQKEAYKMKLLYIQSIGCREITVSSLERGCKACISLTNKTFRITELLKKSIFPPRECTYKIFKNNDFSYCICDIYGKNPFAETA